MAATVCPNYTVRRATRDEVSVIKQMTKDEGWPTIFDYLIHNYDMDSRAWFVAVTDKGDVIGVRVLVYYTKDIAAGGLYIVRPEFRGHGVGRDVNAAALAAVDGANVVISATNIKLYESKGFIYDYDLHLKRILCSDLLNALPCVRENSSLSVMSYSESLFEDLARYDAEICKHERIRYLKNWIINSSERVCIVLSGRVVIGYGSLRLTEYGYQIAPLYADSESAAWLLMKELLENYPPEKPVDLIINSRHTSMINLIKNIPHKDVFTLHKMYNMRCIKVPLQRVYSLTNTAMSVI